MPPESEFDDADPEALTFLNLGPDAGPQSSAGDIDDDVILAVERLGELPALARAPFRPGILRIAAALSRAALEDDFDAELVFELLFQPRIHLGLGAIRR